MGHARELFQLRPERLPIAESPQPPRLEIVAGQVAHLQQEPQVAALHGRAAAGPLENLDDALRFLVALERAQHEQKVGRIAPFAVVAGAGVRPDQHALAGAGDPRQQMAVAVLGFLAFSQPGLVQLDLIDELDPALGHRPNGSADGCQGIDDAIEDRVVIFERCQLRLGELSNLAHQIANLLLRLFDEFGIDRLFRAHEVAPQ